jgi:hypothetical protein
MPGLTIAAVLQLAPDAASAQNGQVLATERKWVLLGKDEGALWGECQGSGAKPYRVQVDLSDLATQCSCPSRKFPCKHGLGLMLLYAARPDALAAAARPKWVAAWLASRAERAAKKAEKQEQREQKPVDAAAQAARRAKRWERVRAGCAELQVWLLDQLRRGLAGMPAHGYHFFENQARRLIDAQAPGAARLILQLGELASSGTDWQLPFVHRFASLHLLCQATERLESLPTTTQADLAATLGLPTSAEELAALPAIADSWLVIAQQVEVDDRLRSQRNWLLGRQTKRTALVLHFAHGTAPLDARLRPGTEVEAELVFYPGSHTRAALRSNPLAVKPLQTLDGHPDFAAALARFAAHLAEYPWLDRLALVIDQVRLARQGEDWWLVDLSNQALPLIPRESLHWTLLAITGGQPAQVVAEWDGRRLRPLSVMVADQFHQLVEPVSTPLEAP